MQVQPLELEELEEELEIPDEQAPVPEEEELEEELEEPEEELELDEEELEAQMKSELHMELSRPLLAQHRGVPPRKEQVVL